jgi:hypothetical protein
MTYYPFVKNWRKIKKAINDKRVQDALVKDFNKFTYGRWGQKFTYGQLPAEFESCDWRFGRSGRHPKYWSYVKHAACHWLVNFNLEVAKIVEPEKNWRILTGACHSTVWDGEQTLFDMNFSALDINPNEAFAMANEEELPVGKKLIVYMAEHISKERSS